jgi:hypothetical protein
LWEWDAEREMGGCAGELEAAGIPAEGVYGPEDGDGGELMWLAPSANGERVPVAELSGECLASGDRE